MKNHIPKITVGLPVYNSGKYLRECIDSILCQTFSDFELLIIDDGSTDDSISIINSYTDKRIRFIKKNHDYIGTINLLLTETKGKYFARMDSDDVMLPQRLELQYKFMESHKDYDLVGGGYQTIGETEKIDVQTIEHVDLPHMIDYCCIVHPTVMIRKNIIKRYKLRYKKENIYAEDYGLWLEMLMFGLKLYNMPEILIQYRFSNNQVSVKKGKEQFKIAQKLKRSAIYWLLKKQKEVKNNLFRISNSPNLLTLVVPFYNEREEVYNTLKNARETGGMSFDIIVIDDCSDDGYDYQNSLKSLNIHYVKNNIRIGAAQSKEKGISMVKTPYFLLLDAHMRFYKSDWVDTLIKYLQEYDREILCCQTKVLKKIDGKVFECDKSETTFGANISFSTNFYMPYVNWCYKQSCTLSDNQIACVLGAGYATSTQYWNYLKGYQGLLHYGSEEAYISIKSWLFGNGCRLIPEIILGHIYRNEHPYRTYSSLIQYNYLPVGGIKSVRT